MLNQDKNVIVSIIMGSQSDYQTMIETAKILQEFCIPFETKIISAHRTPDRLYSYAKEAHHKAIKVIIAGAGGAAHLPGMVAALTTLPVLGVPIQSKALNGMDSLFSIVQMPAGVPVGTLAIGTAGAKNAALLACSILSINDINLQQKLEKWKENQANQINLTPK